MVHVGRLVLDDDKITIRSLGSPWKGKIKKNNKIGLNKSESAFRLTGTKKAI
jgi:hypothetical protein